MLEWTMDTRTRSTHAYDASRRSKLIKHHVQVGRAAQVSDGVQRAVHNNGNMKSEPKYCEAPAAFRSLVGTMATAHLESMQKADGDMLELSHIALCWLWHI